MYQRHLPERPSRGQFVSFVEIKRAVCFSTYFLRSGASIKKGWTFLSCEEFTDRPVARIVVKNNIYGTLKFPCPEGELDTWTLTNELLRADQNQRPVN